MSAKRWPGLDGLRGVAILLVVVAHAHIIGAATGGMVGVTLFFVLSGFLITFLLLDEREVTGRVDLKAFYGRRALRLLPALFVYLIGMAALVTVLRLDVPILESTLPPALYTANYAQILGVDLYTHRHTWSLAVEEHFYLVWPVLVILGATRRIKALAIVIAALIAWRVVMGLMNPVWAYMATDTNAYALGIGCLLATVYRSGSRVRFTPRTAEAGVAVLVLLSLIPYSDLDHLYRIGIWMPPVAAIVAAVTVWSAVTSTPRFLSSRSIRWFGAVSYSLYLWHAPLMQIPGLADSRFSRLAAALLAIGIAWLSWTVVEGPILRSRWRRRLVPVNRGAVLASENA